MWAGDDRLVAVRRFFIGGKSMGDLIPPEAGIGDAIHKAAKALAAQDWKRYDAMTDWETVRFREPIEKTDVAKLQNLCEEVSELNGTDNSLTCFSVLSSGFVSWLGHEFVGFGSSLSLSGFEAVGAVADFLGGDRFEQVLVEGR